MPDDAAPDERVEPPPRDDQDVQLLPFVGVGVAGGKRPLGEIRRAGVRLEGGVRVDDADPRPAPRRVARLLAELALRGRKGRAVLRVDRAARDLQRRLPGAVAELPDEDDLSLRGDRHDVHPVGRHEDGDVVRPSRPGGTDAVPPDREDPVVGGGAAPDPAPALQVRPPPPLPKPEMMYEPLFVSFLSVMIFSFSASSRSSRERAEAVVRLVEARLLALHRLLDHRAPEDFLVLALQGEDRVDQQRERLGLSSRAGRATAGHLRLLADEVLVVDELVAVVDAGAPTSSPSPRSR